MTHATCCASSTCHITLSINQTRTGRPFGARRRSSVRDGTRLGDLKESWFIFPIKHSTHPPKGVCVFVCVCVCERERERERERVLCSLAARCSSAAAARLTMSLNLACIFDLNLARAASMSASQRTMIAFMTTGITRFHMLNDLEDRPFPPTQSEEATRRERDILPSSVCLDFY